MKKSVIFLISLLVAGTMCFAGCQTKDEKNRATKHDTDTPIEQPAEELPPYEGMPNVKYPHRNGIAVQHGFGGSEIIIINFGFPPMPCNDCDEPELPDYTPAEPNN